MEYLLYLSVLFALVSFGFYLLKSAKRDENLLKEPAIVHSEADTKTVIPQFKVPNLEPKKMNENNRDLQFTRSLERIVGFQEQEVIENNVGEDIEIEKKINEVPIVNHGNSHSYYQQILQEKESDDFKFEPIEEFDIIEEDIRSEKINNLLKKASELAEDNSESL